MHSNYHQLVTKARAIYKEKQIIHPLNIRDYQDINKKTCKIRDLPRTGIVRSPKECG